MGEQPSLRPCAVPPACQHRLKPQPCLFRNSPSSMTFAMPATALSADVLGLMVKDNLVLVDDGEPGGPRLFWVPCTGIEPAVDAYRQQRGL